jgi:hypothetical protein
MEVFIIVLSIFKHAQFASILGDVQRSDKFKTPEGLWQVIWWNEASLESSEEVFHF